MSWLLSLDKRSLDLGVLERKRSRDRKGGTLKMGWDEKKYVGYDLT